MRAREGNTKIPVESQVTRNIDKLSRLHSEINSNIGNIQKKTAQILTEQQKDVQRQFDARMKEVTRELEEERKKKLEGVGSFEKNESKLIRELELMKTSMDLIESKNQSLRRENRQIQRDFREKDLARDRIMKEVVSLKRENAGLEDQV